MKLRSTIYTILGILILLSGVARAQDITLSWDPSPSDNVTGYNVYYKAGEMSFPFDGIGADQGTSPVDVGNTLSTTLTGLSDGVSYFFTVTAYDGSSNQSTYSNIVSTQWIPELTSPANGSTTEPVPVTFRWQTAPDGYSVTYRLYYGTDQAEVTNAGVLPPATTTDGGFNPNILPLVISTALFLLLLALLKKSLPVKPRYAIATVVLAAALTACGGGGGGGSSSSADKAVSDTPPQEETSLFSIDKGTSDYHQDFDLKSGTTYYWKIVATDTTDANLTYESQVQSFSTETF